MIPPDTIEFVQCCWCLTTAAGTGAALSRKGWCSMKMRISERATFHYSLNFYCPACMDCPPVLLRGLPKAAAA